KDFLQYSTNIFCDAEAEDLSLDIKRINPDYVIGILTEIIFPEPYLLFENTGFNGISGTLKLAKYLQEYEQSPTYKYLKMLRKIQK
ncbi:hypothetical protein, partial [Anaerocolumna jejuensis]|uniref:hypothetical protein n=1 Tax=Anaerocolumna jejuensis TaxID=259063 RepID=UPI003F7B4704